MRKRTAARLAKQARPVMRVGDLAEVLDVDERTAVKWLAKRGVPIEQIGDQRGRVVWLADLAAAVPELRASLELAKERDA